MEEHTFNIPNISCGHCTSAIESELKEIEGILNVRSDIEAKRVTVQWEPPITRDKIIDTLEQINYPAAL
jgi:copper chaperone CopZ